MISTFYFLKSLRNVARKLRYLRNSNTFYEHVIIGSCSILGPQRVCHYVLLTGRFLDRSLMIGWRKIWKKSWNPETVSSVFTFVSVCLSVCLRATEHTFRPRNLIFELKDPWEMRKKRIFFVSRILEKLPF